MYWHKGHHHSVKRVLRRQQFLDSFDLETTGLARTSDILQIACVCGDIEFSVYTRPTCTISIGASAATGLTYYGGVLKLKGEAVDSLTIFEGLEQFIAFVSSFPKPVLIGHNIISFDFPVLMHNFPSTTYLRDFKNFFLDLLILSSCPQGFIQK